MSPSSDVEVKQFPNMRKKNAARPSPGDISPGNLLLLQTEDPRTPTHQRRTLISSKAIIFWVPTRYLKKMDLRSQSRAPLSVVTLKFYEALSSGHRFQTVGRFFVFGCIFLGYCFRILGGLVFFECCMVRFTRNEKGVLKIPTPRSLSIGSVCLRTQSLGKKVTRTSEKR